MKVTLEQPQFQPREPRARQWTRAEYYQMAEAGMFRDQRVELIDGEVVVMSPMDYPHALGVDVVADVLRESFGIQAWVRQQLPVDLGPISEPEPDVSVVEGTRKQYNAHPRTALLLVEVSSSSLAYDRECKGSLYARNQIADYWILNLIDRQLEVYRDPIVDASKDHGFRHATVNILKPGDSVTPLARAGMRIPVARFFA